MTTPLAPASGPDDAVTIGDLLGLPALAGTRVVPSDAALTAVVSAVTLSEPEGPPEPGALVLHPGGPPAALPEGAVAVVCRTPPRTPLGVPVLVLPADARWGAVVAALAAGVAGGLGVTDAARARVALREPLLEGRGYPGLVETAAGLLGRPIAILDEYLDVLGLSGLDDDQQTFLDDAILRARGHGPASIIGPFVEERMPGMHRELINAPGGVIGVLVVWSETPMGSPEVGVLAEVGVASMLERAREEVRTETESRLRGDLIEELMAGEVVSRESLVRRARHLGADLSGGAVALIGKLQDPHTEGRVITDPRLVRRFLQQARAAMDLHWPRSLVDWDEGRLLALLPAPASSGGDPSPEDIEAQAFTLGKRLLGATRETVPGLALTLALSRYTPEPERLGVALDEARLALSIGERLGRVGEVVTFEETGTYKLLFQIFADRPEELISFYDQTIAPLVRYDEQYQTELVGTLSTYLGHDCNLAATASTLYTHRHTVRYRLDRIAELSGLDIAKTDDREKLSLGLKAMRLLGRRVATPAQRPSKRRAS